MNLEGKMLSHAKKPHLVGKNLKDFNKYGNTLFQEYDRRRQGPRHWLGRLPLGLSGYGLGQGKD